jgi:hypothetical protein
MTSFRWILIIQLLRATAGATAAPADETSRLPFETMSRAELNSVLQSLDDNGRSRQIRAALLESGRLDLIEESLRKDVAGGTKDQALALPESDFKDSVILLLLRSDLFHYVDYGRFTFSEMRQGPLLSQDPFRSIIMKYLPGLPLEDRLVSTPAMRKHLADSIEEAKANPSHLEDIKFKLRALPTKDFSYTLGKGLIAPQDLAHPTPEELAAGKETDPVLLAIPSKSDAGDQSAKMMDVRQQASLKLPLPSVNAPGSRPRATASSWLLWTGLAAFNAVILLTLQLTTRHLRRRDHGI